MNSEIRLVKVNGKTIFSIFSPSKSQSKDLVIMCHGFRGDSTGPARSFVEFSNLLNANGFSVLRFDQPNSGNSEGNFIDSSFHEWVEVIKFLVNKYTDEGYDISLLGQSTGATALVIACRDKSISDNVNSILLWVPGIPDKSYQIESEKIYTEDGQKYKGKFWLESREVDFFESLAEYKGSIHLVYGEHDRYVSQELRDNAIKIVHEKKQDVLILKGQDHSPWDPEMTEKVFSDELRFLNK